MLHKKKGGEKQGETRSARCKAVDQPSEGPRLGKAPNEPLRLIPDWCRSACISLWNPAA